MDNKKLLWSLKDDYTLMLWPKSSRERYLGSPFVPVKSSAIQSPNPIACDYLRNNGISYAAITTHKKGYFCERVKKKFSTIMFVLSGSAEVSWSGKKQIANAGSVFLSATGSNSVVRVSKNWQVIWFHIEEKSSLGKFLGKEIVLRKSKKISQLSSAVEIYAREAYSNNRSDEVLEHSANLISTLIREEFYAPKESGNSKINKLIEEAKTHPEGALNSKRAAKSLKISQYNLDKFCLQNFALTYAKIILQARLCTAKKLLLKGFSCAETAQRTGFSNSFALSKAFKKYYKKNPSQFARKQTATEI